MADAPLMFDDLPSFDDMPEPAAPRQSGGGDRVAPYGLNGLITGVPKFDDMPSFDNMKSEALPEPEGAFMSGAREAAHAVIPAVAGLVGMGAGAAVGLAGGVASAPVTGPVGPVVGPIIGGVGGMVAASMGAATLQEEALKALGVDDSPQRQANKQANPTSSFIGEQAPLIATMNPAGIGGGVAKQLAIRGGSGAISGAFEAGQEYLQEGHVDPTKAAIAAGIGVALPNFNKVGQTLSNAGERLVPGKLKGVPGRPNTVENPEAAQAHADVNDVEVDLGNSPLATPPATGETTGNPASAPVRSERNYAKDGAAPQEGTALTQGALDPALTAAVEAAAPPEVKQSRRATKLGLKPKETADPTELSLNDNSRPPIEFPAPRPPIKFDDIPGFDDHPSGVGQAAPTAPPVRSEEGILAASQLQREAMQKIGAKKAAQNQGDAYVEPEAFALDTERPARPVDPGFPKEGEPVAVGANEATPLPSGTTEKTAAAIKRSKAAKPAEVTAAVTEPKPPAFKGEAPINDSITDKQKIAGNYPKARANDFGKPLAMETHAGDIRRGKSPTGEDWEVKLPYDYGYFNKTKGADSTSKKHEGIDWARPKEGAPELGDKHFIIDQRNAETGKFDEHKVFTYYKDADAARAHYEAGFSDGKGPDRLGAITEVSRGDLVKFLAKHTKTAANKPYAGIAAIARPGQDNLGVKAKPSESAKLGEPKVVARARELMVEKGLPEDAIERFNKLEPGVRAAEATKYVNAIGSKTFEKTGAAKPDVGAKVTRIRPKAAEVPGTEGITARSKADAKRKGDALAAMRDAVEKHPPGEGETPQALRTRLDAMVAASGDSTNVYKPAVKPASYLLLRQAKQMLLRKTWKPAHVEAFTANEKLLRSGDKDAVADVRTENRVEADIARSRRSGDEAVASAEAKRAVGNTAEDDMIAAIDAKRGGKFDVPHEESEAMVKPVPIKSKADLPKKASKKTVDVADSVLAKIDTKKIDTAVNNEAAAKRKAEAAALQAKKAAVEPEKPAPVKNIQAVDPNELKRLNELMNKAAKRGESLERSKGLDDVPHVEEAKGNPFKGEIARFFGDESGAVNPGKIKADLAKAMKTTTHTSYIAKTSKIPHSEYVRSLDESLHKVDLADDQHKGGIRKQWNALPKELNNPKTLEKIYHLHEQGKLGALTPEEKALYDTHLKPVFDENESFVQAIRALDPDIIGPDVLNHISRIAKNDDFARMLDTPDDPTAARTHTLVTKADSSKLRKFVALERVSDGKRFTIGLRDKGFTLWDKYKAVRVKDPSFDFEAGKAYKAGPVDYIMRDAFTHDIEANARGDDGKPMKYYKNAALSAYIANAQLGSMARQLTELHRIANTPEFKKLTARPGSEKANAHPDWEASRLKGKLFNDVLMDPHLRYVFDDYAKAGFDTPEAIRKLSQGVTKLLFWTPVAHMANVGVHWQVGRGWDWITPKGTRSLFKDGFDAIKSVVTQDDFQRQLAKEGAGLILPSVMNRRFIEQVFKGVGEDIKRRPSEWRPILKQIGLGDAAQDVLGTPLRWFDKHVYDNSAKVMWAANDMFITQRVKELMRKGKSMKEAIVDAERDIPNYRVPTTLITEGKYGRIMQQMATSPELLSFGRYHYGVFNSFSHIFKGLLGNQSTLGDRADAAGKLFAMGIMAFIAYPIMDKAAKLFTGNPDATQQRRGPLAVASHIADSASGKTDVMQAMRSTTTVPPLTATVLETLFNRDFRGKQIVEPGDVREAFRGNVKAGGRALLQEAEHAVKGLVSPYSTLANAHKKDLNPLEAVRDQLLDQKNPSAKGVAFERKVPILRDRDARTRFKHGGSGPLEELYNKLGYR